MGKIKEFWTSLTAPYEDEAQDDYMEAVAIVCSNCLNIGNPDECEHCPVTASKESIMQGRKKAKVY